MPEGGALCNWRRQVDTDLPATGALPVVKDWNQDAVTAGSCEIPIYDISG
jgi:hypothetical protein